MELVHANAALLSVADGSSDGDGLAEMVEQAVRRETGYSVRDLIVLVTHDGVLLKGRCDSFYCKQMAQHAAMGTPGADRLINAIEVG